ncbi:MAG: glycosyltransferase family 4 protein [Leptolyngbyaceae cyanobacterium MO_188.B28]|nr:glycosyltransferase family 4 protein [Leptolyngbyaceae cyanobacterium MO_188.B28]
MPSFRLSLVHPTGSPFARQAAFSFAEVNILQEVVTTVAYKPQGALAQFLNSLPANVNDRVNAELKRRDWMIPVDGCMRTHPWCEVIRLGLVKTGLTRLLGLRQQTLVDWVYASLDRHVAEHHLQGLDGVYAYEDGAAATFQTAKLRGILCLYELPIVFYRTSRTIQWEEAQRFPKLAPALQAVHEPTWKIERKEQEIQLADHIFVPSSLVRRSLVEAGIKSEKISVIPYGSPIDYFYPYPKTDSCFRVLFVGRVGPRKGVHYLLQAWRHLRLPNAELLLVGMSEFPEGWLARFVDDFRYVSSAPHASLNEYYSAATVFVFPSLVEGFGLVLLEAMACGVAVITTPNTAGPDIITDGVEGFIIPIRDVDALKEKVEWCYRHPQELAEMGRAARKKAEQLAWNCYRQRLVTQVQVLLSERS